MTQIYNDPVNSAESTIGPQIRTDYFYKTALIEAQKEQYFSQLANVKNMPKNMGKEIKVYQYLPMLDDANINDQGIDAAGVAITTTQRYVTFPAVVAVANAGKAAAVTAINANINNGGSAETIATAGADGSGGTGLATITLTKRTVKYASSTQSDAVVALNIGAIVQQGSGNLYGSSKDVGVINGKLPALSETGGRVNRVGFKRKEIKGSIEKFGFFDEYTQESIDFDSDEELMMHVSREMIRGANEITEDALQIDLLNAAGIVKYSGTATSNAQMNQTSIVSYGDLMRLNIDLDNNRCPKHTTVITGTRLVDTKTINSARVLYCGSEMLPTLEGLKDLHNERAFISIEKYAGAGTVLRGEAGAIGQFRIVVVPEMMNWSGAGASLGGETAYYSTNDKFNIYPMLVVGDSSFSTIGFQTDGKTVKFKITHKKPGEETADRNDPYGETGFMSIKWYYGFLKERPERIAVQKTVAKL